MGYFCEFCDESIKLKSKNNHLKPVRHIEVEKCFQKNHTNENPNFFDIGKIHNDYATNHNKSLIYISLYVISN